MDNTFSTAVDNTLSIAIPSANVAGPATKRFQSSATTSGTRLKRLASCWRPLRCHRKVDAHFRVADILSVQEAKSNNEDVAAFRVFLVAERAKLKKAVDDAPADRRPELDYQFAGITDVLSRGKVDIDEFAALNPVQQYLLARAIKAKLAKLKETLKRQVDSYVVIVMLEKLDPVISGTAQGRDAPSGCMENTRGKLLRDIIEWANSPTGPCVFWLSGLAGTGKTTVARSVADRLAQTGIIVVSFFISRHSGRRNSLYDIVHTLAFELAQVHETARAIIIKALEREPSSFEPLCAIFAASPIVLVLDALDECNDPAALVGDGCLAKLIPALCGPTGTGKMKLFLTSRPLTTIGAKLRPFLDRLGQEVRLHEIPTTDDIRTYLGRRLSDIRRIHDLPTDWPSTADLDSLVHRAGSLFIYAATVIRHITQDEYAPHERLAEPQPLTDQVRQIIAAVVLARAPMSTRMISDLLDIDRGTVWRIVSGLGAVWVTPVSESDPIVLYHKSFPDFILDTSRCTDQRFVVDCSVGHARLATGCLHVLNTLLVRDICKIPFLAGQELPRRDSISDIDARLMRHVSPPLRYATVHLLHHLAQIAVADISEALVNHLRAFCREKLMFWLELTCLMGPTALSNLIVQLAGFRAEILLQDHDLIAECGVLLRQLGQAAQYFEEPLRASHAEVYNSLLAFMPRNELQRAYSDIRGFIKVVRADDWDYPANRALIRADGCVARNLVTTADGSVVACVWVVRGKGQSILVWQNATQSSMHYSIPVQEETLVLLALHPSGRTLAVSTCAYRTNLSQISVWQLSEAQPVLMRTRSVYERTLALALDPTGMHVVLVSPHSVITLMLADLTDVIGCCHEFPCTVQMAGFSSAGTALMAVSGTPRRDYDDDSSSTDTPIMRSDGGVNISRLQWQPTPQLQRIHWLEGSTSGLMFIDHSACVLSKSDTIMLYSITAGKITFQQKLSDEVWHATVLSHGHAIYAHGSRFLDFIDTQATSDDSGPRNVSKLVAQSSCGLSVAVLETSESDGTVGTVWNISSGTSHTVAAPELIGEIIHFELTRGDLNLVAMDVNGLAVLPTNFTPNAERQYIRLRQEDLWPSGLIFSHNQERVAVHLWHMIRRSRQVFIWDFPTFSNRRELDLGDSNGPVDVSRNCNLVAWAGKDMVHVSLVDQADGHSHCQLPARDARTIVFCTTSLHLIVMDRSWLLDLWDLTNVRTPVLLRSFQIDIPIPLQNLILFNDGDLYIEIYLLKPSKHKTRKIRGVSPWTTIALSDDQHNQTESKVKAVCPAHVYSSGDVWLNMELGTNRMLRASLPKQEGESWSVVDAERRIGSRLCWLPELHRPKRNMHHYDLRHIFWSGSRVFCQAESGAVTILDFSDHPLFQAA
ncbi:hypothetical protein BKA62DRAFT_674615 [Auriculariales sp. MPI-PUGE-AT-0066]|nr:hypothetical protein BKA62DRAFT_674615 [Auriculariales sp. MPI-PUGE-AT-0066]